MSLVMLLYNAIVFRLCCPYLSSRVVFSTFPSWCVVRNSEKHSKSASITHFILALASARLRLALVWEKHLLVVFPKAVLNLHRACLQIMSVVLQYISSCDG